LFKDNKNQLEDFFGLQPNEKSPSEENFKHALEKKISWRTKLRLLPRVLSFRERYLIFAFLVIAAGALVATPISSYFHFTQPQPASGGSLSEGIIGEPRLINPLLSQNNDADRDLQSLVYSGLLKFNGQGKLVPDLAKSYDISADGLSYTVYLREGLQWQDGAPLTADDVVFTVQTAQNPDFTSPQRVNWQGVDMEEINNHTLIFKLKNKYGQFLNSLTMGIMPKHLWQDVKPINFNLSELNLKPIGAGPYKFDKLVKDKLGHIISYQLSAYQNYYDGAPYIQNLEVKFYNSEEDLINAYNNGEIENLGFISAKNISKIKFKNRLALQAVKLPRYFVLFFNQNRSKLLSDKDVRLAINYAIDKKALVQGVLDGNGIAISGPVPADLFGTEPKDDPYPYNPEKAKQILNDDGWSQIGDDGIRVKKTIVPKTTPKSTPTPKKSPSPSPTASPAPADDSSNRLTLNITTSTWPELDEVATMIKDQLKAVGIDVVIETLPISRLQQAIKDRDYQTLLFGEILTIDPDPLTLWHSSQKRDPGLNLALYENKSVDTLLEDARQTLNPVERLVKYDQLEKLVTQDAPAAFLYSPLYLYELSSKVHGFDTQIISMPSDRFLNISKWYINTKRVFK